MAVIRATRRAFVHAALLALLQGVPFGCAALEPLAFDSASQERRFRALLAELRCLVCQNQSLADSNAELAGDLRREVHAMLRAGGSDAEIVEFMVARYGDFVLYRPPFRLSTALLWLGPGGLLAGGLALLAIQVRRRAGTEPGRELDPDEQSRLLGLLAGDRTPPQPPSPGVRRADGP